MARKVSIKSAADIEMARKAGALAAEVLQVVAEHVRPGVTTDELDRICHDHIVKVQQAIPANIGYHGFPKTICASPNHVICHGIPSSKVLKNGDILNIDVAVIRTAGTATPAACTTSANPARWPAGWSAPPTKPCAPASWPSGRAPRWATSATPSRRWRTAALQHRARVLWPRHRPDLHDEPQVLHYGRPGEAWCCSPA